MSIDDPVGFGEQLARLKSVPEKIQTGIVVGSLALAGYLWFQGSVSPMIIVCAAIIVPIILYAIALRFGSELKIYESGFEINSQGNQHLVDYGELESIASKITHHYMNNSYVASKAEFTFGLGAGKEDLEFECDFNRKGSKTDVFNYLTNRCSEAIQERLIDKIKTDGFVEWTPNVHLSEDGFHILKPGASVPMVIPFHEIEEMTIVENELKVWKKGDLVLPFFIIKNDTPNFIPMYDFFQSLCESAKRLEAKSDTVPEERTPTIVQEQ